MGKIEIDIGQEILDKIGILSKRFEELISKSNISTLPSPAIPSQQLDVHSQLNGEVLLVTK